MRLSTDRQTDRQPDRRTDERKRRHILLPSAELIKIKIKICLFGHIHSIRNLFWQRHGYTTILYSLYNSTVQTTSGYSSHQSQLAQMFFGIYWLHNGALRGDVQISIMCILLRMHHCQARPKLELLKRQCNSTL